MVDPGSPVEFVENMCLSNSAETVCRLPISIFAIDKAGSRMPIPFCVHTRSVILAFLAENNISRTSLCTRDDGRSIAASLFHLCNLDHGHALIGYVSEQFLAVVFELLKLGEDQGRFVGAVWIQDVMQWGPDNSAGWLRVHCHVRNHSEPQMTQSSPCVRQTYPTHPESLSWPGQASRSNESNQDVALDEIPKESDRYGPRARPDRGSRCRHSTSTTVSKPLTPKKALRSGDVESIGEAKQWEDSK
ncbi:hypothetical protein CGLO_15314 [Colletotrichum gloeosporioides Cg-14]|uniref:Uncharacterized protein n=1 Tax=Colletotrichum gloeosporioides (strain Cg-14) TaxID=1237896 RepID=T0K225_COLGC|nr:hypothetical protein CGLO_15314 [Colletotrichum gloeosporioides Cg-14]